MENLFETIAAAINPKLAQLETELIEVECKIKRIEPQDEYTSQVARSFHLGMVGGSGKNTTRLNRRREAELDRTIERAKMLVPLYTKRDNLIKQISDIKDGTAAKKEENVMTRRIAKAEMWKRLKAGDELPIGNSNGNPVIKTKNRLSVITTSGTKWTASEVIGKEAARLI